MQDEELYSGTIYLIRHGMTAGNRERRYVGSTDEDILETEWPVLTERGNKLRARGVFPEQPGFLAVSPMIRSRTTAKLLMPDTKQHIYKDLRECSFGAFEYRNHEELLGRPDYGHFLETYGKCGFPEGESYEAYFDRTNAAYLAVLKDAKDRGPLVICAHGGTIRVILASHAEEKREFYEWPAENGCIYRCIRDGETGKLKDVTLLTGPSD